jgi:hypothetical protein
MRFFVGSGMPVNGAPDSEEEGFVLRYVFTSTTLLSGPCHAPTQLDDSCDCRTGRLLVKQQKALLEKIGFLQPEGQA